MMIEKKYDLQQLSSAVQSILRTVGACSDQVGVRSFLVGGMVRDLGLGKKSQDIDIVIEGDAQAVVSCLEKHYSQKALLHATFQTATFHFPDGVVLDLARAREEQYPHKGALPVIRPSLLKNDISRRDFTVNALMIALNSDHYGELVAEEDVKKDFEEKQIRVFHDESFLDDPTRILRAIRYAVHCEMTIEKHTLSLMKKAIQKQALLTISPVRYFHEFKKILSLENPLVALNTLHQLKAIVYFPWDLTVAFYIRQAIERKALKIVDEPCLLLMMILCSFFPVEQLNGFLTDIQIKKEWRKQIVLGLEYQKISHESPEKLSLSSYDRLHLVFLYVMSVDDDIKKRIQEVL